MVYFNPRSPQGGATNALTRWRWSGTDFNPRSPQGGATIFTPLCALRQLYFNPRSPQGGATHAILRRAEKHIKFQSTLPARGSDITGILVGLFLYISIHAPRKGERQCHHRHLSIDFCYFNPRSPQGGATRGKIVCHLDIVCISIHAPRKGERRWYCWGC